jgi:gamma-glutamylcyclotransferase (GGCT)/AIG2-like uncharacterized protein YtfP
LNKLFVYGTLMTGASNHDLVAPFCESIQAGTVNDYRKDQNGSLAYAVPCPGEKIAGQLLELQNVRTLLAMIDILEGYYYDHDVYIRKVVRVKLADGSETNAYMYVGDKICQK